MTLRKRRDKLRQRRLPRARRAVEDDGRQPIRLEHPPQQLPRPKETLLPHELIQRPWPHAHGQRRYALKILLANVAEQVHSAIIAGLTPAERVCLAEV